MTQEEMETIKQMAQDIELILFVLSEQQEILKELAGRNKELITELLTKYSETKSRKNQRKSEPDKLIDLL